MCITDGILSERVNWASDKIA